MNEAPDFCEPFIAWRVWKVVREGDAYSLGSVIHPTFWPAGEALVAECRGGRHRVARLFGRRGHPAPEERCACGIYAGQLECLGSYLAETPCGGVARVVGEVALWGTVVECERGFRASHAYPVRIHVPADAGCAWRVSWEDVALGLSRYRVPVELLASRASDAAAVLQRQVAHT